MTIDLITGMWDPLGPLGAIPCRLVSDNESGIGRRNSFPADISALGRCPHDQDDSAARMTDGSGPRGGLDSGPLPGSLGG